MPVNHNMINALLDNRIEAIRQEHKGGTSAELDLSGGIDSLAMACILVLALGPENVTLVHSRFNTNSAQTDRAQRLADALACPLNDGDFSAVYEEILGVAIGAIGKAHGYKSETMQAVQQRMESDPTIKGSIRSTLRAPIGRMFLRLYGAVRRHGTGNECEDRWLRFYQKGGDGEVDSNPLAMLSKGEVYQLCWFLSKRLPAAEGVILDTIKALPSPDLWGTGDGHSDEDELLSWTGAPFTYSRINPETGEYNYVGTIERVSRFLDTPLNNPTAGWDMEAVENVLFDDDSMLNDLSWPTVITAAKQSGYFNDFSRSEVEAFLFAARKAERITRHKMNPNCPSYGTREELVRKGILTNDLPVVG